MQDKQSKCHMTRNMAATNINYQTVVRSIPIKFVYSQLPRDDIVSKIKPLL